MHPRGGSGHGDWKISGHPNGGDREQGERELMLMFINQGAALTEPEVERVTSLASEPAEASEEVERD